jgi:hypothetical protein
LKREGGRLNGGSCKRVEGGSFAGLNVGPRLVEQSVVERSTVQQEEKGGEEGAVVVVMVVVVQYKAAKVRAGAASLEGAIQANRPQVTIHLPEGDPAMGHHHH